MREKSFLLAVALVSLALTSGCISSGPLDCESDESCFANAQSSCKAATVNTLPKDYAFGSMNARYTMSGSVLGMEGDLCLVKMTFEDIEMTGNLTETPAGVILQLYNLSGSPITCTVSEPMILSMEGINASAGSCSGEGLSYLAGALRYYEAVPPGFGKALKVSESFCVGGQKIVVYVRNEGIDDINLSEEVAVIGNASGEELPVEWKDFTGFQRIGMLYPLNIGQFEITDVEAGSINSYEIRYGGDTYPFSAQC
ncbi:MAG: hypothetical protein JXC85_02060 [Candidatus Aenigmarchaeota archaeon]|nr:hypothetical protein [Candidatus Aenigmarchaeota archaeon]